MNKLDRILGVYKHLKCEKCACLKCKHYVFTGCGAPGCNRNYCSDCLRAGFGPRGYVCAHYEGQLFEILKGGE